jgi:hypothetical protein
MKVTAPLVAKVGRSCGRLEMLSLFGVLGVTDRGLAALSTSALRAAN